MKTFYEQTRPQNNLMVFLCRTIQSPELKRFLIIKSGTLVFGIQNRAPKFRVTTKILDPESNREYKYLGRRERNPRLLFNNIAWGYAAAPNNRARFSRFLQIQFTFYFTGTTHSPFNCSNYTFHENSTEGRDWERSRELCQKSSEGDLVSIEEEEERIFLKEFIMNLKVIKYYIGLKKTPRRMEVVE